MWLSLVKLFSVYVAYSSPQAADPDGDLWFHTELSSLIQTLIQRITRDYLHSKPVKDLNENHWILGSSVVLFRSSVARGQATNILQTY